MAAALGVVVLASGSGGGGSARTSATASPFAGRLLIADRGNNRLLLVNAAKQILWRYPSKRSAAPRGGFYFPDDAFFTQRGTGLISNQEDNETIVRIAFPSGQVTCHTAILARPAPSPAI